MSQEPDLLTQNKRGSPWLWVVGSGALVVVLLCLVLPRPGRQVPSTSSAQTSDPRWHAVISTKALARSPGRPHASSIPADPKQVVAFKVSQFASSRREIVSAMATKFGVAVPPEVGQFFDAVRDGNWEKTKAGFEVLKALRQSADATNRFEVLWPAINEAYGVAQAAHNWPSQALLDYGDAVLGSLRPGMIYVGGTDAGRFIPTLLAETSEGDHPIVLTQNALADRTYLDYASFLYGDKLSALDGADSDRAFSEYLSDARKRLEHDQAFPNEPKQVRPGEDLQFTDGRFQVSGQVAVMAINERLFQRLMDKNPGVSFALEESFPFKSTYANAVPLGPIMELNAGTGQYSADTATQVADFWRNTAGQLSSDPQIPADSDPRKEYSKMAAAQARLLQEHNFPAEAEQAYRSGLEICPSNPEVTFSYINLLLAQGRVQDALQVAQTGLSAAPDNAQFRALVDQLKLQKQPAGR